MKDKYSAEWPQLPGHGSTGNDGDSVYRRHASRFAAVAERHQYSVNGRALLRISDLDVTEYRRWPHSAFRCVSLASTRGCCAIWLAMT